VDLGDVLAGDVAERRVTLSSASPFPVAYTLVVDEPVGGLGQQPAFYCRWARRLVGTLRAQRAVQTVQHTLGGGGGGGT
jgi:hypothetical protein